MKCATVLQKGLMERSNWGTKHKAISDVNFRLRSHSKAIIKTGLWKELPVPFRFQAITEHSIIYCMCRQYSVSIIVNTVHFYIVQDNLTCCPLGLYQYKYGLSWYMDFRYTDKTVVRTSYLYNGKSYTGKTSLYWDGPLVSLFVNPVLRNYLLFDDTWIDYLIQSRLIIG